MASVLAAALHQVFGSLRQVVLDNGQVIEYLVDGRNRRIGKKIDGALVQGWLYDDQLRILAELDGQANVVARFVYADGINVPELMEKGGRTYRLIKDQLGSVRLVVDVEDGSIVQEMRYDAWGNVVFDSNPSFQPFGFAGGWYDPQPRLVRFGARDYDASIGRWLSKDPSLFSEEVEFSLYSYALLDSTNVFDPVGLTTFPTICWYVWRKTGPIRAAFKIVCFFQHAACRHEGHMRCLRRMDYCEGERNACFLWVDNCCFEEFLKCFLPCGEKGDFAVCKHMPHRFLCRPRRPYGCRAHG